MLVKTMQDVSSRWRNINCTRSIFALIFKIQILSVCLLKCEQALYSEICLYMIQTISDSKLSPDNENAFHHKSLTKSKHRRFMKFQFFTLSLNIVIGSFFSIPFLELIHQQGTEKSRPNCNEQESCPETSLRWIAVSLSWYGSLLWAGPWAGELAFSFSVNPKFPTSQMLIRGQ